MLQNNPDIQNWQKSLRSAPKLFLILLAASAIVILMRSLQAETLMFSPILLLPFAIMIGVYGVLICQIRWNTRKSLLQLQERMLAGDTSLLATQQPVPNRQALRRPSIIKWQTRNSVLIFIIIYIVITVSAVLVPFLIFIIPSSQLSRALVQIGSAIFGSFILILIVEKYYSWKRKRRFEASQPTITGFFALTGMQSISVDEKGFRVGTFGTESMIPWNEAQCFCIVGGGNRPNSQLVYMLASKHICAKWVDAPSQSFWPLTWYRPLLTDADHQLKMQKLLQIIAGKTGLSLYDFRSK